MARTTKKAAAAPGSGPRQPLALLLSIHGDFDMRRTTTVPDGWAAVWRSDRVSEHGPDGKALAALGVEHAMICTKWLGPPGYGGGAYRNGWLVPADEAERVARVFSLLDTGKLRVRGDRANRSSHPLRLEAVSPLVRVEVVELPADPDAVAAASGG